MTCPALDIVSCNNPDCPEHWPGNQPEGGFPIYRRMVPAFGLEPTTVLPDDEDFDRNWCGPAELKPNCYRSQSEKDTWMSVAVENEYQLKDLNPDDVVIDIGANIGAFCHLAYHKGSRCVYGFELEDHNIPAALLNLRGLEDGVLLHHAAVVRGDSLRSKQYYANGGWHAFGVVGKPVDSISLDEILQPHQRVRFLKLDCEGAEWPILYTCTQLEKVQEIAGEYHIINPQDYGNPQELTALPYPISLDGLERFFVERGFRVHLVQDSETIGHFYATHVEKSQTNPDQPKSFLEALERLGDRSQRLLSQRFRELADYLELQGL